MDTETGVTEAEPRRAQRPARRFALGLFGLILGVAGLATAVAGPFAAEALAPPPEPAKKAAEVIADAGDKLAGRLIDRVKGKRPAPAADAPPAPQPVPWAWYFSAAAMSLGVRRCALRRGGLDAPREPARGGRCRRNRRGRGRLGVPVARGRARGGRHHSAGRDPAVSLVNRTHAAKTARAAARPVSVSFSSCPSRRTQRLRSARATTRATNSGGQFRCA